MLRVAGGWLMNKQHNSWQLLILYNSRLYQIPYMFTQLIGKYDRVFIAITIRMFFGWSSIKLQRSVGYFVINMKTTQYKIVHQIGQGQYGHVYLATHPSQQSHYAIKSTTKNKEQQNEAHLLAQMRHPNIIEFVQYIEEQRQASIVMEHAANGDLSQFIKKRYPNEYLPQNIVKSWILQLTLALHYLHEEMNLIHRDIKLINVLVSQSEVLKLCDFGLAQQLLPGEEKQNTVGTPYYLSPESIMFGKFSTKSDIWSLGCLIYEICTGHKPFTGKSMGEILKSITNGYFDDLPEQAQYSKWLTSLLQSMLQKDPEKRPSTRNILEDEQFRKEFIQLKKKHQEYKHFDYPHVQVRTKKHVIVEQKLGENFKFANAMVKTAKREKSIKLPQLVDSKFEKEQSKRVQRVKFANKSLQFLLQKKQPCLSKHQRQQ